LSGHGKRDISGISWSLGGHQFLAVVWEPEGIVLTPRSDSAPHGYGFPKRKAGVLHEDGGTRRFTGGELVNGRLGTLIESEDDEILNQIIINRFENNKYLDRKEHIVGLPEEKVFKFPKENRRLRASIQAKYDDKDYDKIGDTSFVIYWPPFYFPTDESGDRSEWSDSDDNISWHDAPGLDVLVSKSHKPIKIDRDKSPMYRQFQIEGYGLSTILGEKLIYERESSDWFCHWPEELLYDNDGYEMLFHETNQYRADVGRLPMFREIRGHANLARMVLSECQRARVLYHDNDTLYRQGYKTVLDRIRNAGSNWEAVGENLLISSNLSGLGIDEGEGAAVQWKSSPPHYANMISAVWDEPINGTSHIIMGDIRGKTNEAQYGGTLNPPITGAMWSQLFVRRDYWVMAGNIGQTTRYGTVSFFWNNSPVGFGYTLGDNREFYLYFKGRSMQIIPFVEKYDDGYKVSMKGAAICRVDDALHVRVLFYATRETTQSYHVYRRPLIGNHIQEWTEEASFAMESNMRQYSVATFDDEGERAVINRVFVDTSDTATYYFPLAPNQFVAMASSMSFMEYSDGEFYVIDNIRGPTISYTVETADNVISRYRQKCESADGIRVHCFRSDGDDPKYLTVKYDWDIDQTNVSSIYQNDWHIIETLVFPSGKELVMKSASASSSVDHSSMVLAADSHVLIFLYIDPVTEDTVYAKISLRGEGTSVYGQATIFADLHDSDEPSVVVTFAETLLNENSLAHPNLSSDDTSAPGAFSECYGIINTALSFGRDASGELFPIFQEVGAQARCASYQGILRALTRKPLTGTHRATLDFNFGDFHGCLYDGTLGVMNFTYPASIKIADYSVDGVACYAVRYKDKFVLQLNVDTERSPSMWNIPFTEQKTVWANFDLDGLVGIGNLKDVFPMGVIL
jgi:hypothetical protein